MEVAEKESISKRLVLHSSGGNTYELRRNMKKAIYGCVFLGVELEEMSHDPLVYTSRSEKKVAIKVVEKERLAVSNCQEDPLKEMAVAQYLSSRPHPNIMEQLESIQDDSYFYIVMPFSCGGELFDVLDRASHFSEDRARQCFRQVLEAVEYLHSMGVVHRDISLENVLIDKMDANGVWVCKVIDFGMSLRFKFDENSAKVLPFPPLGPCGKRYYMAPEVLANRDAFDGTLADIWALGVLLFILVVGAPPVDCASPLHDRFCRIASGQMKEMVAEWRVNYVSNEAMDLMQLILQVDPMNRPSLADIKDHPWMNPLQEHGV